MNIAFDINGNAPAQARGLSDLNSARNQLALCKSKTKLYEVLEDICTTAGFSYDLNMGFSYNMRRARSACCYKVAEVIHCAKELEGRL